MPTVLDSLVLEFNLDPSNFNRGQREIMDNVRKLQEEAQRRAGEVESSTKKIFDLMSSFRREALTALSIFFGGREIGQFVDHVTRLDASTGRLAKTIGMSTSETGAWQGAIRQMGGSAESANAALKSMNDELVRYSQTGQGSFLGVFARLGIDPFDKNRNLKTADQIFLDMAAAIERSGMDPRQAAGFLRMAGANEDMINFILTGTRAMREFLQASRQAGTATEMSAAASREYQKQVALLDQTTTNLGRNLLGLVLPTINSLAGALARLFASWNKTHGSPEDKAQAAGLDAKLRNRFGSPRNFVNALGGVFSYIDPRMEGVGDRLYGTDADENRDIGIAKLKAGFASLGTGAARNENDVAAYIKAAAIARGIDPNVALAVWASEGRGGYVGDEGSSFGPFQLHYGGISASMPNAGLGDLFTKQTGRNARDPSTWRQQVDFSLDYAKAHGWGSWMGWRGDKMAGIGGGGVTVNVGGVTVNDNSGNADHISTTIGGALKRSVKAGLANTGAQ